MDFRLICVGTKRRVHCRKCGRSHCRDQHAPEKIKIKWNAERWSMKDKDSERLEKFSGKQANSTSMWCELLSYLPTSTTCSLNLPVPSVCLLWPHSLCFQLYRLAFHHVCYVQWDFSLTLVWTFPFYLCLTYLLCILVSDAEPLGACIAGSSHMHWCCVTHYYKMCKTTQSSATVSESQNRHLWMASKKTVITFSDLVCLFSKLVQINPYEM